MSLSNTADHRLTASRRDAAPRTDAAPRKGTAPRKDAAGRVIDKIRDAAHSALPDSAPGVVDKVVDIVADLATRELRLRVGVIKRIVRLIGWIAKVAGFAVAGFVVLVVIVAIFSRRD